MKKLNKTKQNKQTKTQNKNTSNKKNVNYTVHCVYINKQTHCYWARGGVHICHRANTQKRISLPSHSHLWSVKLTLYVTARVPGWNLRRHEEDMQIPQKQAYDLVAGLF